MSYPQRRSGRQAGITSNKNAVGTQEHQGSRPGPIAPVDELTEGTGNALELHEGGIHIV